MDTWHGESSARSCRLALFDEGVSFYYTVLNSAGNRLTKTKILKGRLRESRYAMPSNSTPDGPLVETARSNFAVDKVAYISDQIGLHEITNPHPTEYAVSLHRELISFFVCLGLEEG